MSDNPHHPYELAIQTGSKPGTFQWTIRRNGKLAQRSDKPFRSREDAQKDGEKAIERQHFDSSSSR